MPTTTQSEFTCRYCSNKQPIKMAQWNKLSGMICSTCLDTKYFTCSQCGKLKLKSYQNELDGFVVCDRCWGEIRYWEPTPNPVSIATYDVIGSKRKYGIELESHTDEKYRLLHLRKQTLFGAKDDCTVSGLEFYSPILYGDEGLREIVTLCNVARDLGWRVNDNCGYHLHIDMRDETGDTLHPIAYAFMAIYDVLRRCVKANRHDGVSYCHPYLNVGHVEGVTDFITWAGHQDRYNFLNVSAYHQHGTFENRLHEGTFDPDAVCNWIILNLRIADAAAKHTVPELKDMLMVGRGPWQRWCVMKKWINDDTVAEFYEKRIQASRCDWFPTETPITV